MYAPVTTIEPHADDALRVHFENPTIRLEFESVFAAPSRWSIRIYRQRHSKSIQISRSRSMEPALLPTASIIMTAIASLDCYNAFDSYPGMHHTRISSFPYGFARGVQSGTPFWILEFMSGGGHGLRGHGRRQSTSGFPQAGDGPCDGARGADAAAFPVPYIFRTAREQLNYAIVDMDGVPAPERCCEARRTSGFAEKPAGAFGKSADEESGGDRGGL